MSNIKERGTPVKKLFALVFALLIVLSTSAFADGELTVTQEAFHVIKAFSNYAGVVYAELLNTSDERIRLSSSMIELFDQEGNSIASEKILSCSPPILEPGEVGYINHTIRIEEVKDENNINDYALTIKGISAELFSGTIFDKTIRVIPSAGAYGKVEIEGYEYFKISATVNNNTNSTFWNTFAVIALYDSDDKLIYADTIIPSHIGIPPGQSISIWTIADSQMLEVCVKNGVSPARIVTIAYSED